MRWYEINQAHKDRLIKAHSRLSGEMRTVRQSMADSAELKGYGTSLGEEDAAEPVDREIDRLDRQKAQAQIRKKREEIRSKERQLKKLNASEHKS